MERRHQEDRDQDQLEQLARMSHKRVDTVHSPSKTGVNALIDALWRNPGDPARMLVRLWLGSATPSGVRSCRRQKHDAFHGPPPVRAVAWAPDEGAYS